MSYHRISQRQYKTKTLHLKCTACGSGFDYVSSTGIHPPKYCSDFCRGRARHAKSKSQPLCVIEGCSNHRAYAAGVCNSCYYRLRRTGISDKPKYAYRSLSSNGYVVIFDRSHPLSSKSGHLKEHRKVLYDAIGEGTHSCHWCGTGVRWIISGKCVEGSLVPDHLDGNKSNNKITNLVPSCNTCNAARGMFQAWVHKHKDDPWLWALFEQHCGQREAS